MKVVHDRIYPSNGIIMREQLFDTGEVRRRPYPETDELPSNEEVLLEIQTDLQYLVALEEINMEG